MSLTAKQKSDRIGKPRRSVCAGALARSCFARPHAAGEPAPAGVKLVNREWDRGSQPRRWIRAPGAAGFTRGSVLFQKGLHHVVCILASTVDNGLSYSVSAPRTNAHTFAALGPASPGSAGGPEPAQHLHGHQPDRHGSAAPGSLRAAILSRRQYHRLRARAARHHHADGGELPISDSVTINGPGANKLSVSGDDAYRVFDISNNATVTIDS